MQFCLLPAVSLGFGTCFFFCFGQVGGVIPAALLLRILGDAYIQGVDFQSLTLKIRFKLMNIGFNNIFNSNIFRLNFKGHLVVFGDNPHTHLTQKIRFQI